jgi:hypothetical protein
MAKAGRPSKGTDAKKNAAAKLLRDGLTMSQVAEALEVARASLYRWRETDETFRDAIKEGHEYVADGLELSLYARARGYSHPEEKIFCNSDGEVTRVKTVKHYPPDTTALIFALKNKRPSEWRDRKEVEIDDNRKPVDVVEIEPPEAE